MSRSSYSLTLASGVLVGVAVLLGFSAEELCNPRCDVVEQPEPEPACSPFCDVVERDEPEPACNPNCDVVESPPVE